MADKLLADIMPTFRFRDADAAMEWLVGVLGCREHAILRADTGAISHGELSYGNAMLMIGSFPDQVGGTTPELDLGHSATYFINDDDAEVEAAWDRAVAAGAPVVDAFKHQPYGGTSFTVEGPEGHYWTVGSYRPTAAAAAQ